MERASANILQPNLQIYAHCKRKAQAYANAERLPCLRQAMPTAERSRKRKTQASPTRSVCLCLRQANANAKVKP